MIRRGVLVGNLFLCMALAGCGGRSGAGDLAGEGQERISCAIGPGVGWTEDCLIEQDRDLLTVRHVDGGFRRFQIVHDGRGVVPADGAEQATIVVVGKSLANGTIEVRDRRTGERDDIPVDEVVARLLTICQ